MIKSHSCRVLCMAAVCFSVGGTAQAASLDPTFGEKGTVLTKSGFPVTGSALTGIYTGNAWAFTEDRQGRLLAGGGADNNLFVARYLEDGNLDPSFGVGGKVYVRNILDHPSDDGITLVRAMTVLPDGKIVLAAKEQTIYGQTSRGRYSQYFRLLQNGQLDASFGSRPGFLGSPMISPRNSVARPDGGYYIVGEGKGSSGIPGTGPTATFGFITAYGPEGRLDKSFGGGTGSVKVVAKKWPFFTGFGTVKRLGSGKLLIGGYDRDRFMVARMQKNGKWDRSFGTNRSGRTIVGFKNRKGQPCYCAVSVGIATDKKGRIYQSGWSFPQTKASSQRFLNVLRYMPNGKLDRGYGRNGRTVIDTGAFVLVKRLAVLPSGRAFVTATLGSASASKFGVFAFLPDGKPDRSFFGNGRYVTKVGSASTAENALIDSKGRLVVAGGTNLDDDGSFMLKRFLVK